MDVVLGLLLGENLLGVVGGSGGGVLKIGPERRDSEFFCCLLCFFCSARFPKACFDVFQFLLAFGSPRGVVFENFRKKKNAAFREKLGPSFLHTFIAL